MIFGASGLLGTHLTPLLQETHTVYPVARRSSETKYSLCLDLSADWTAEALPEHVDSVVYLAQSEKFRDFPESAESVFRVNTLSLLKAFDYALRAGAKTFVFTSSGGVYGNLKQICREDDPLGMSEKLGYYLSTKVCGEIIAGNYTSFMNVVVLRPFFVYGPGQRKDMLIPRLVERVRNGQPVQLAGKEGLEINPLWVGDAAMAVHKALMLEKSCIVNIAGPEVLSMRRIGEHIGQALGKEAVFECSDGEPARMVASIEKMEELLWKPVVKFEDGVKRYVHSLLGK